MAGEWTRWERLFGRVGGRRLIRRQPRIDKVETVSLYAATLSLYRPPHPAASSLSASRRLSVRPCRPLLAGVVVEVVAACWVVVECRWEVVVSGLAVQRWVRAGRAEVTVVASVGEVLDVGWAEDRRGVARVVEVGVG